MTVIDRPPPPADILPFVARQPETRTRYIDEDEGELAVIDITRRGPEVLGPITSHTEAESIAWHLLQAADCQLPEVLHKLCTAYLAARGKCVITEAPV